MVEREQSSPTITLHQGRSSGVTTPSSTSAAEERAYYNS